MAVATERKGGVACLDAYRQILAPGTGPGPRTSTRLRTSREGPIPPSIDAGRTPSAPAVPIEIIPAHPRSTNRRRGIPCKLYRDQDPRASRRPRARTYTRDRGPSRTLPPGHLADFLPAGKNCRAAANDRCPDILIIFYGLAYYSCYDEGRHRPEGRGAHPLFDNPAASHPTESPWNQGLRDLPTKEHPWVCPSRFTRPTAPTTKIKGKRSRGGNTKLSQ